MHLRRRLRSVCKVLSSTLETGDESDNEERFSSFIQTSYHAEGPCMGRPARQHMRARWLRIVVDRDRFAFGLVDPCFLLVEAERSRGHPSLCPSFGAPRLEDRLLPLVLLDSSQWRARRPLACSALLVFRRAA
jgi:hypothetical protein